MHFQFAVADGGAEVFFQLAFLLCSLVHVGREGPAAATLLALGGIKRKVG
ncbi:MAG: hypothetical protein AB7E24_14885 [Novosphingobium sp.]